MIACKLIMLNILTGFLLPYRYTIVTITEII